MPRLSWVSYNPGDEELTFDLGVFYIAIGCVVGATILAGILSIWNHDMTTTSIIKGMFGDDMNG